MLIGIGATVYGGVAAALKYLLKATFTRADTGPIANGTVLNSAALGVEDGSLTVVDTSTGTVEVLSNKLKVTGSEAWNTTGWYSQNVSRAIGKTCIVDYTTAGNIGDCILGLAASTTGYADFDASFFSGLSNLSTYNQNTQRFLGTVLVTGTQYTFAFVLGGYDVNGVPYKSGDTKANFVYGSSAFIKGGIYASWTLYCRDERFNTATLYVKTTRHTATGSSTFDNLRIPDKDLSAVLQPTVLDTFTDTNGTALTAHTSDVGAGAWTAPEGGIIAVQSNKASRLSLGTGGAWYPAVKDFGLSDGFIETVIQFSAPTYGVIVFRYINSANYWRVQCDATAGFFYIIEVAAGVTTNRAGGAYTWSLSTDYKITLVLNGQNLSVFANGTNKMSYSGATSGQTVTSHGFSVLTGVTLDNMACFPRTSATYETEFGAV